MTIDEITGFIESLGDVLTLRPGPGDGSPDLVWGDRFFYYSPDGTVPPGQPFATIVTKDYPDAPPAGLDRPGAFRVNVAAGRERFRSLVGRDPRDPRPGPAPVGPDVMTAHPTYGTLGWVAVVDPGPATRAEVLDLLRGAHAAARARHRRRHPG